MSQPVRTCGQCSSDALHTRSRLCLERRRRLGLLAIELLEHRVCASLARALAVLRAVPFVHVAVPRLESLLLLGGHRLRLLLSFRQELLLGISGGGGAVGLHERVGLARRGRQMSRAIAVRCEHSLPQLANLCPLSSVGLGRGRDAWEARLRGLLGRC